MAFLRSVQFALMACVGLMILANCTNASQQNPPVSNMSFLFRADLSALSPRAVIRPPADGLIVGAGRDRAKAPGGLYVGQFEANYVNEYSVPDKRNKPPRCTDSLPNITVNGIAVNEQHVLYVPNGDPTTDEFQISTYARDCGKAGLTLNDPSGEPTDVAFNNKDGTVYVSDYRSGVSTSTSYVLVYAKGHTSYSRALNNPEITTSFAGAVDSHGNVYQQNRGGTSIAEYPAGREKGSKLILLSGSSIPTGLEFDRHDDLVVVDQQNGILVYAPPYTGAPIDAFPTRGTSAYGQLDARNRNLYVSDINGSVDVYAYPSGTYKYSITNGLSASNLVEGIAVDPPSPN